MMRFLNNIIKIVFVVAVLGAFIFTGAFFYIYQRFTYEKPIAEIIVTPSNTPQTSQVRLKLFVNGEKKDKGDYFIKGDQWMLEGDVLRWDVWLHTLGLDNHYRLTRLRGRYLKTRDELNKSKTIYNLVPDEEHWFWKAFYRVGQSLPFIKSVYGNAVFQNSNAPARFLVYANQFGFSLEESSSFEEEF